MTTTSARLCTCGTGPNVSRCPAGHLEPTRRPKGKSTKCPHREDDVRCGRWAWVLALPPAAADDPASSPVTQAPRSGPNPVLTAAWASMPEWSDDEDAILWRPDEDAGNCPKCGRPRVAEPGRTMVCCPPCFDWDDYPEVIAWRDRQYAQRTSGAGQITAGGSDELAEQLAAQRQHDVECGRLEREIRAILAADKRLTSDCQETLSSYLRQIERARSDKDGQARLERLRAQYQAEPIERRGWYAKFDDVGSYLAWLVRQGGYQLGDDEGLDLEGELAVEEDDYPEPLPGTASPPVPGFNAPDPAWRQHADAATIRYWDQAGAPMLAPGYAARRAAANAVPQCEKCLAAGTRSAPPSFARIRYNGVREWDVCAAHVQQMAQRSAGILVEMLKRYDQGQGMAARAIANGSRR